MRRSAISELLWEWAAWRQDGVAGLGYPSCGTIGRVMTEGLSGAAIRPAYGPRLPKYAGNPSCNRIDRIVAELPAKAQAVLMARHLSGARTYKAVAQRCGLSESAFVYRLTVAHRAIERTLRDTRRHAL